MEKEHTLWDWFSEGLGSSVLCEKKNAHSKGGRKTPVLKKITLQRPFLRKTEDHQKDDSRIQT